MTNQKASSSILHTVLISQFCMPFMFSGIAVTLPIMGVEMQASGVALSLVEIVFLGAAGALTLPFGKLADMTDKQAIYRFGLLSTSLFTLLLGFVRSIDLFIVLRLCQGLAFALVVSTNMAILTETIPRRKLGKALGLSIGSVYVGLSVGPFAAGIVTEHLGWRWIYRITAVVLLLAFVQSVRFLKGRWRKPAGRFDTAGGLCIVAILGCWIVGSSTLNRGGLGIALLLAGAALVPLLILTERRAHYPILEFRLFRTNGKLSRALAIQLFTYSGTFGIPFLFSLYLQVGRQYSPRDAGFVLMISPVLMAALAPVFGRLSDRFSPRRLATFGVLSSFVGSLIATRVSAGIPIYWLYAVLALHGIGFAMFSSPNMKIIMTSVDRTRTSVASALAAGIRSLGMIVSMLLVTLFMSLFVGQAQISADTFPQYLQVMRYSAIGLAVLGGLSLALSLKGSR